MHWVEATGELYRMREPKREYFMPARETVSPQRRLRNTDLTVELMGRVKDADDVGRVLDGWDRLMTEPDGLATIRSRL